MIVQAAKIIGSGLATIGLINILLSLLTQNKDLFLSNIVYTELVKKAPFLLRDIINNTDKTFESIGTACLEKPDVRTIKSHYNKGTLYKGQYYIISK
jgi:hypothetical protein